MKDIVLTNQQLPKKKNINKRHAITNSPKKKKTHKKMHKSQLLSGNA